MKTALNEMFWIEPAGDNQRIGFSPAFFEKVGVVWNVVPSGNRLEEKKPFLFFESSRCLTSLKSPVSGGVVVWNDQWFAMPNKLTTEDFLMEVSK